MSAFPISVVVFPGSQNLPLYMGIRRGFFRCRGIDVQLSFAVTSLQLRDGLANGKYSLAHTAVDNAVAMRLVAGHDVVVVMGGDSGMNELFVQPDITAMEALRGRRLLVDAPDTAYALQAKSMLRAVGLIAGVDYEVVPVGATYKRLSAMLEQPAGCAAAILNPPFSVEARDKGLRSLGRATDHLGPYQATAAFAMRPWISKHEEILVQYLSAYVEALRYVLDKQNAAESIEILMQELRLSDSVAARTYQLLTSPGIGLDQDAHLNAQGLENVLEIRSQCEGLVTTTAAPSNDYINLTYHALALASLTTLEKP